MHDQPITLAAPVRIPLYARNAIVCVYTLVDAADAAWVNQWRWGQITNARSGNIYAIRRDKGRRVWLHRELLGLTRGDGIDGDHMNRDTLDNRRTNLRPLPQGGNAQNTFGQRRASSQFRGVSHDTKRGTWEAYIGIKRRKIYLGHFATEAEAAQVARQARLARMPYALD